MTSAEKYVTAAYLVVLAVVLAYLVIYAFKLSRLEREVGELAELARRRAEAEPEPEPEPEPERARGGCRMSEAALLLVWPALAGYAEAAVAYAGDTVRPGRLVRYAIWGVRIGWLAQTALLVAQAAGADGFPWGSWAASLNLFVWMCVGVYLIWGCRAPFRLLGLVVMPLAAVLLALAWAAGGVGEQARSDFGDAFLAFHVGLILAAFAGFTLAAALAALYLWQDRRLKHRVPGVLRLRSPSLQTLDQLTVRAIAVALPALTVGAGIGLARLRDEGASFDPIMGLTLLTWAVYAAFLVLRWEAGWRGRRTAYLALAGFLLVVLVRVVLTPFVHF